MPGSHDPAHVLFVCFFVRFVGLLVHNFSRHSSLSSPRAREALVQRLREAVRGHALTSGMMMMTQRRTIQRMIEEYQGAHAREP